ncbi:MAG TPA: YqeG family HAD IIIA-type phosphatase [Gemmataceae bacterium]|nr:YqeG family HAD IIIA-type phosphatase [Gemmataceae bacterium]
MLRLFTPKLYCNSVLDLDAPLLHSLGLKGLLLDVDGTLKDFRAESIPAEVCAWLTRLRSDGFKLCLLSNGRGHRIGRVAAALDLPFIAKAFKPLPMGCRRALKQMGLERSRVAMVGDQVFADVMAGRLAGLFTILVPPTSRDEPWFTRLKRPLESLTLRYLKLQPKVPVL